MSEHASKPRAAEPAGNASLGWLDWVARHPGAVLLGTLVVASLLLMRKPAPPRPLEFDRAGEEVPLFI